MSDGVEELLEQKLADPAFYRTLGDVSQAVHDGIREGLSELPEDVLRAILNSEYKVVTTTPDAWAELMRESGVSDDKINTLVKAQGFASVLGAEYNIPFGDKPTIVIFEYGEDLRELPSAVKHEAGHGMDHINSGYTGFVSGNENFREAYAKYEAAEKLDQLLHKNDRAFAVHAEGYDENDRPKEVVAEMIQKYSTLCQLGGVQVAERIMSNEFPFVWDALKQEMPQIGSSLRKMGYDLNARPLVASPEHILTDQYLHRGLENFELHISVHGLSENEIERVVDVLTKEGINLRRETGTDKSIFSTLVVPTDELDKFRLVRDTLRAEAELKPEVTIDALELEEYKIAKELFPRVTGMFKRLALGNDGTLIMELNKNYDLAELSEQMGIEDLSDADCIRTSSDETKTLAVAFNRLPENLQADLSIGFNVESGHTEEKRVSAQKLRPDGGEDGEEPGL